MTTTLPHIAYVDTSRARRNDPITSYEAADSSNLAESSAAVLAILATEPDGMADWEIELDHEAEGGKYTGQRLRTARHELVESGLVEDAGTFSQTLSGRRCKVWRLTT